MSKKTTNAKPLSLPPYPATCAEVMRLSTHRLEESDSVLAAARLMRDENIGFLPVLDARQAVSGVVTDRDIAVRVCAEGADPKAVSVGMIMSRSPIACGEADALTKAEALMRKHHITRIVIVDDLRRLLGVVSLSDIAQYVRPSEAGRTLRTITERKYGPERP